MPRVLAAVVVIGTLVQAGCASMPPDPLQLERGVVTVDNRTADEWQHVEIWANQYFRAAAPSIAAGSRLQVPLDAFVSGYGRRFDPRHTMVTDLRLVAMDPRGEAVTLRLKFRKSGLAALGGQQ